MGFRSIDDPGLQEKFDYIAPSRQAVFSIAPRDGVAKIDGKPIADMPEALLLAHALIILTSPQFVSKP